MKTLLEMLDAVAERNAERAAVVDGQKLVSYKGLKKRIAAIACELHALGVRNGDRVALLLPNGSEFVAGYFAIVALGAIVVPLNDHYQENELLYFLNECGVSLLITSHQFAPSCRHLLSTHPGACQLVWVEDQRRLPGTGSKSLGDFKADTHSDSPVMYQFSSGSTGRPKRIRRTHANLLFEINSLVETLQVTHEDRILGVAPFSHVNGLMRSMMASIGAGATLCPLPKFERQMVAETIEKNRISIFIGVPFMFGVLTRTNFQRRPDFSSLRLCVSASAPMPPELNRQFHERFGIYVRQLYGSTETGTISVNLSANIEGSLHSVGRPIAGVDVDVFAENGQLLQLGEIGEIAVKSPAAITSYDGSDELNRCSFRNGYFLTGDLGRKDQDGLLYLCGRKKYLINKGGYKINPREIEDLLETHPKIAEAVVVGLPTPFGDERVKAMIVLNDPCTEEEIIEHCRRKIADFKIPSLIEFRKHLARTPTGKIRREMA